MSAQNQVEYNVDISINGQQFSGYPMIYRFYEIKIDKMFPNVSSIEGGLVSKITGQGLFDSLTKKAKISSSLGERFSDMQWDRSEKALNLVKVYIHYNSGPRRREVCGDRQTDSSSWLCYIALTSFPLPSFQTDSLIN